jgi:hypothetical protein
MGPSVSRTRSSLACLPTRLHRTDNVIVVDQVLQVGVEAGERLVLLFEFPIEIVELLIEGMQFLVCRLQFLDQGRYFLAC